MGKQDTLRDTVKSVEGQATSLQEQFVLSEIVIPTPEADGLDTPYWEGLRREELLVQRCRACRWQWGPEWICYECHTWDLGWEQVPEVEGRYTGVLYSWKRVWHPTHSDLARSVPYVVLMVTLETAGGVRMFGNLLGDPCDEIAIGTTLQACFEHHEAFTLVQWATAATTRADEVRWRGLVRAPRRSSERVTSN